MKDNSFKDVTIGLSGGIDSALCTVIATDAVGSKNVRPVFMPTILLLLKANLIQLIYPKT